MNGRHPYTYACDLIRAWATPALSRSDASQIRQGFAQVLGIDDTELAIRLSRYFQEHQDDIIGAAIRKIGFGS